MKRVLASLTFCSFIVLFGCNTEEQVEQELRAGKPHASTSYQAYNYFKKPAIWNVKLTDPRTNESVVISLNDFGYFSDYDGIDEQLVEAYSKQLAKTIDQTMINPTIDPSGAIISGQNRIILAEQELVEKIMTLDYREQEIILPIYETEPTVKEEELEGILDFELGSYTTYFNPNVTGRSHNIKLSAEAIQHHVLGQGDIFSFNKTVGERTVERGYKEAKEIVNNEFVMGIGGGICQTSSTLFNAIDAAGLEVIERYTHSREIGYVPANRDATVSWGGPDFVFTNPYPFPILIKTEVLLNKGQITVKVFANTDPNE